MEERRSTRIGIAPPACPTAERQDPGRCDAPATRTWRPREGPGRLAASSPLPEPEHAGDPAPLDRCTAAAARTAPQWPAPARRHCAPLGRPLAFRARTYSI